MKRKETIQTVSARILDCECTHPLRVGIDGVDASGKTTFAEELAQFIHSKTERQIIRASIDGFHNPSSIRTAKGNNSPEGYYNDSFNYDSLVSNLLEPLGPGGNRTIKRRIFDFRNDSSVFTEDELVSSDSILLFDGVFLHRSKLLEYWDLSIFLDVPFETTVARAMKRDTYLFGDESKVQERYKTRYVPGQLIYLKEMNPKDHASIVIDNSVIEDATILFIRQQK